MTTKIDKSTKGKKPSTRKPAAGAREAELQEAVIRLARLVAKLLELLATRYTEPLVTGSELEREFVDLFSMAVRGKAG